MCVCNDQMSADVSGAAHLSRDYVAGQYFSTHKGVDCDPTCFFFVAPTTSHVENRRTNLNRNQEGGPQQSNNSIRMVNRRISTKESIATKKEKSIMVVVVVEARHKKRLFHAPLRSNDLFMAFTIRLSDSFFVCVAVSVSV